MEKQKAPKWFESFLSNFFFFCIIRILNEISEQKRKNKDFSIDFHRIGSTDSIRCSVDGKKKTITKEAPANLCRAAPDLGDNVISHQHVRNMFVRAQGFHLGHMGNMTIIVLATSRSTDMTCLDQEQEIRKEAEHGLNKFYAKFCIVGQNTPSWTGDAFLLQQIANWINVCACPKNFLSADLVWKPLKCQNWNIEWAVVFFNRRLCESRNLWGMCTMRTDQLTWLSKEQTHSNNFCNHTAVETEPVWLEIASNLTQRKQRRPTLPLCHLRIVSASFRNSFSWGGKKEEEMLFRKHAAWWNRGQSSNDFEPLQELRRQKDLVGFVTGWNLKKIQHHPHTAEKFASFCGIDGTSSLTKRPPSPLKRLPQELSF